MLRNMARFYKKSDISARGTLRVIVQSQSSLCLWIKLVIPSALCCYANLNSSPVQDGCKLAFYVEKLMLHIPNQTGFSPLIIHLASQLSEHDDF